MKTKIKNADVRLKGILQVQLDKRLTSLISGDSYTLAGILGEEFWENEDEPHKAMGRAFSSLVEAGEVPFQACGWTKARSNEYIYTPEGATVNDPEEETL